MRIRGFSIALITFAALLSPLSSVADASVARTMLGGSTDDPAWYASHIGRRDIYRGFSTSLPRYWHSTGYADKGTVVDYSFDMPANKVYARRAAIKSFIATTPKNLIITWAHEPELRWTPAQFRAGTRIVADIVHAQNRRDGGHRRYQITFVGWTTSALNPDRTPLVWWPGKDSHGRNYVDIIAVDCYPPVVGPKVHAGYTDGSKWTTVKKMLDPTINLANKVGARWSVSEFGFLEYKPNPNYKANMITELVRYSRVHHAVAIEYWDGDGPRAYWRLNTSWQATRAWRRAVNS